MSESPCFFCAGTGDHTAHCVVGNTWQAYQSGVRITLDQFLAWVKFDKTGAAQEYWRRQKLESTPPKEQRLPAFALAEFDPGVDEYEKIRQAATLSAKEIDAEIIERDDRQQILDGLIDKAKRRRDRVRQIKAWFGVKS